MHLHDPDADSHRQKLKKDFKHKIICSRARFRAFLLSFGLPIVSGVAKEQQRTRPRQQKHVNVHYESVAIGDSLYSVRRRDMCADLESGWVRSMGSCVRRGSFRPLPTLAERPHRTNDPANVPTSQTTSETTLIAKRTSQSFIQHVNTLCTR